MLDQQIAAAFIEAYKAKQENEVSTLRMLKSAILNKKIEKLMSKEDMMPDEEVIALLKSEVKKRQDSAATYVQGGRQDLADKEIAEIPIIKKFLPEQMSAEMVKEIVQAVIVEMGNPGPAGFGKIMSSVMAKAKGAADGAVVSQAVKEELAK